MKRLAQLRKEHNLNQTGLAMKLNITQYLVSAYETGRHQPSIEMLIQIADFFNVSVDYLLERSNIRYTADTYAADKFSDIEMEMLDLFRTLTRDEKLKAIGVIIAMRQMQ